MPQYTKLESAQRIQFVIRERLRGTTYKTIGQALGVSPERTRQIEAKGIRIAKRPLQNGQLHLTKEFLKLPEKEQDLKLGLIYWTNKIADLRKEN